MATSTPSDNRVYRFRLHALVIDVGNTVVRNVLDQKLQGVSLSVFLAQERPALDQMRRRNMITRSDWYLLFPLYGPPTTDAIHIGLATHLLLNLKGFGFKSARGGPTPGDLSPEADIYRLRLHRNEIAHMTPTTAVNETMFREKWSEIEQILHRLNHSTPRPVQGLQEIIDRYEAFSYVYDKEEIMEIKDNSPINKTQSHTAVNTSKTEEKKRAIQSQLSKMPIPKVTDIESRSVLIILPGIEKDMAEVTYELMVCESLTGKYKLVYSGDASEITLKDLEPATEYSLKVCAVLNDLRGLPTEAVSFKTLHCELERPKPPELLGKSQTYLCLKWDSQDENGSNKSVYILEKESDDSAGHFVQLCKGLQTQFRVSDLKSATKYTFRLSTTSDSGERMYSEPVSFYTNGSVPSQPDPPLLAECYDTGLVISWTKRPNDNEFVLQMDDQFSARGFIPVYNGPLLSHRINGLKGNRQYNFRITARNEDGTSGWSETVSYRTLPAGHKPFSEPEMKSKTSQEYLYLKEDLVRFYRNTFDTVSLSPLLDEMADVTFLKAYVPPFPLESVSIAQFKSTGKRNGRNPEESQTKEVDSLKSVFVDENCNYKNIYITAEPGLGKTCFAKWLVLNWCQAQDPIHKDMDLFRNENLEHIKDFEFVFLLHLRDMELKYVDVETMLQERLIAQLSRTTMYTDDVLEDLLSRRKCLFILDGLDEWTMSNNSPGSVPPRKSRQTCSYITTSRPWKLSVVSLDSSQIDRHIQIRTTNRSVIGNLVHNVLNHLLKERNVGDAHRAFMKLITEKRMEHIYSSPFYIIHMLNLWILKAEVRTSRCEICTDVIELLLSRTSIQLSLPSSLKSLPSTKVNYFTERSANCAMYSGFLFALGKLAFALLFNETIYNSLDFSEKQVREHLTAFSTDTCSVDDILDSSLSAGLLVEQKILNHVRRTAVFSFCHRLIQEYFAALYIQSRPDDLEVLETIKKKCSTNSAVLEMAVFFDLLEELNPKIIGELSQALPSTIDVSLLCKSNLPKEVLMMDRDSIDLYKKALQEEKVSVHNIRVMVVGHYDVGKTTLTKRLLGQPVDITKRDSTNGIDVHVQRCNISLKDGAWILSKSTSMRDNSSRPSTLNIEESVDEEYARNIGHLKKFIENVQVEKENLGTSDLSVWDFAGQNVFYATHQVFFSRRAIYLLVTNMSKHINDTVDDDPWHTDCKGEAKCKIAEYIDFWLNSIHEFCSYPGGEGPPVVLVGTFADQLTEEMSPEDACSTLREFLVEKAASCHLTTENFLLDNSVEDEKIKTLRKHIVDAASKQDYWGEDIPAKWVTLEDILIGLKEENLKVLHKDRLRELNKTLPAPIESDEELELYLHFHHDMGNILYFSKDDLTNYILLDPQWLIDAFKSVITAKPFCISRTNIRKEWMEFERTAILKPGLIDSVWEKLENSEYKKYRELLLTFMEILGLVARPIQQENQSAKVEDWYFVPCMLKDRPPEKVTSCDSQQCKYTSKLCYTTAEEPDRRFLPATVFNKLLAACLQRWSLSRQNGKYMIFCGGAKFDLKDNHFLYIFFYEQVIQIWITRFSSTGQIPDISVCMEAKKNIEYILKTNIGMCSKIIPFVKCPTAVLYSNENMVKMEDKKNEFVCNCQDNEHLVLYDDLTKYWSSGQTNSLENRIAIRRNRSPKDSCIFDGRPLVLEHDDIERLDKSLKWFAKGGFGEIYKSDRNVFGIPVAVKKIKFGNDERTRDLATREMIVSRIRHQFILPLLATCCHDGEYWFISPYCKKGDLAKAIQMDLNKHPKEMNVARRINILFQIAKAIEYLHTPLTNVRDIIVHKDIASANVVLDVHFNARLIDFGSAREKSDITNRGYGRLAYAHSDVGTKPACEKWDYFSFSIIIRELLTSLGPDGENGKYLKNMTEEEIQGKLKSPFVDNSKAHQLNKISSKSSKTDEVVAFKTNVIDELDSVVRQSLVEEDFDTEKCRLCMINPKARDTRSLNRLCINVCVSCEKNSFLNPIRCHSHCGHEIRPVIGDGWGALLVAGKDDTFPTVFTKDVNKFKDLITSKVPLIMGIREDKIVTVVPEENDIQLPEGKYIQSPEENDIQLPEGKYIQSPEENDIQLPEGKDFQSPEKNDIQLPEGKDFQSPEKNDIQLPEGKDFQSPEKNDIQLPEGKDFQSPEKNDIQLPEGKDFQSPEKNDIQLPEGKDFQSPEENDIQLPEGKDFQSPEKNDIQLPEGKDFQSQKMLQAFKKLPTDIKTLIIYMSCHGEDEEAEFKFRLSGTSEGTDKVTLKEFEDALGQCKEKLDHLTKVILFFDCCHPPKINIKGLAETKCIQLNACGKNQESSYNMEGSSFTKALIQGLKAKAEGSSCERNDCKSCKDYWDLREDYVTVERLLKFIMGHIDSGQTPELLFNGNHDDFKIAFYTDEEVLIEFTLVNKESTDEEKQTLQSEHLKNMEQIETSLFKSFQKKKDDFNIVIKCRTFRTDSRFEVCNTADKVLFAWVNRHPLEVSFEPKGEATFTAETNTSTVLYERKKTEC